MFLIGQINTLSPRAVFPFHSFLVRTVLRINVYCEVYKEQNQSLFCGYKFYYF